MFTSSETYNIRFENYVSQHCHMKDVANDENLKSGDIIAMSESRLVPNDRSDTP